MDQLAGRPLDAVTLLTVNTFLNCVIVIFLIHSSIQFSSHGRENFYADSDVNLAILLSGVTEQFMERKMAKPEIALDGMLDMGIRVDALPI